MNYSVNSSKNNNLSSFFALFLSLLMLLGLQACSSSSSVTPENPDGYLTGTASVKAQDDITDLPLADLQGMVSDKRFIFMSVDEVLVYDGTITSISGSNFSGTVKIYKDGVLVSTTTTVTGTITSEASITGTLTGEGAGNGAFVLNYSLNNEVSDQARILEDWRGNLNGSISLVDVTFSITDIGSLTGAGVITGVSAGVPVLSGCRFNPSTVLSISNVNVYNVNFDFFECDDSNVDGVYTGFATTQTVADNVLVIAFTNGEFSGSSDLILD